jgi:hypothetical protein
VGKVARPTRRFSNFSRRFRSEFAAVGFFQCNEFVGQSLKAVPIIQKKSNAPAFQRTQRRATRHLSSVLDAGEAGFDFVTSNPALASNIWGFVQGLNPSVDDPPASGSMEKPLPILLESSPVTRWGYHI